MKRIAFTLIMILLVAAATIAALAFFASTEPVMLKTKPVSEGKSIEDKNRDISRIDEVSIMLRTPLQPEEQEAKEEPKEVGENKIYQIRTGAKKFFTAIEKLISALGF